MATDPTADMPSWHAPRHRHGEAGGSLPLRLSVVYDDRCELCRRCAGWLATQPTHVEMRLLASSDPEVYDRYGDLPWYRIELMVVDDIGRCWIGSRAFVMCLWATLRYHRTSYRLAGPAFAPLAERFFHMVSSNRSAVSGMLGTTRCTDESCTHDPLLSQPPGEPVRF